MPLSSSTRLLCYSIQTRHTQHLLCQFTNIIMLWTSCMFVSSCWSMQRQRDQRRSFILKIIRYFVVNLDPRIGTFASVTFHNAHCWVLSSLHGIVFSCQEMSKQWSLSLDGFDMDSFHYLLNLFTRFYEQCTPFMAGDGLIIQKVSLSRGRPRLMNPADCLGLVLAWRRTWGSYMVLQLTYWMTMSPVA